MVADSIEKPKFEACELRGGPHDGQTVNVPEDEDKLTFHHAGCSHDYHRINERPVFVHEALVSAMFGGGR